MPKWETVADSAPSYRDDHFWPFICISLGLAASTCKALELRNDTWRKNRDVVEDASALFVKSKFVHQTAEIHVLVVRVFHQVVVAQMNVKRKLVCLSRLS